MEVASLHETPSRAPVYTGILPCQKITEMVASGEIASVPTLSGDEQIQQEQSQPASIDLRLGDFAYPADASFLPGKATKAWHNMRSTGRLDILRRLIADEATLFDQVEEGYEGQLYLEVAPRTFSVVVRTGTRLNQLRFRRSTRGAEPRAITSADWKQMLNEGQVANTSDVNDKTGHLPFSIDLVGTGVDGCLIGWRA